MIKKLSDWILNQYEKKLSGRNQIFLSLEDKLSEIQVKAQK